MKAVVKGGGSGSHAPMTTTTMVTVMTMADARNQFVQAAPGEKRHHNHNADKTSVAHRQQP